MSRPDRAAQIALHLREEVVEALAETVTEVLAKFSPSTRLRLVAFLHLIEHPESVLADLEVDPSGLLRLTLAKLPSHNHLP
jgi:hypothetical protein